jgi:predicted outer membrane repeat protein
MGKIFLFVTVLLLTWFPAKSFSAVVYMDRDRPGGNGSSWETAYNNIEDAIAGSGESQEFWVAEGTYTPSNPLTPKPGSQFYGGFAGNETARNQRDVSAYPTVIDGQNSLKHVVFINMLATNVRIDGFTIKRGSASSGEGWDTHGGGMFVDQQSCVIANCTVTANSSEIQGGGIFVNRAAVTIDNSEFQSNTSTHGGAVGGYESTLTVTNCEFSSNSASQNGGAIYNDQAPTSISNCSFTQNRADVQGGAVSVNRAGATVDRSQFSGNASGLGGALAGYDSDVSISNSQFSSNTAALGQSTRGGAVWLNLQSPEIRNCTFSDNVAGSLGGAVEVNNTPQAIISDCNFIDNSAVNGGGGVSGLWDLQSPEPSVTVLRCSFQGNSSGLEAGAIYSYYCHFLIQETTFISNTGANGGAIMLDYALDKPTRVERCIFIGNSATTVGGAIRCYEQSVEVENSLFVSNSAPNAGAIGTHAGEASEFATRRRRRMIPICRVLVGQCSILLFQW